jgi:RNA polymerase-binding transcription factor DksA
VADDLLAQGAEGMAESEAAERSATRAEQAVAAIDAALRRLDDGTYGRCDGCGAAIPADRLEAIPWAPHCVPCSGRAGAGFLR